MKTTEVPSDMHDGEFDTWWSKMKLAEFKTHVANMPLPVLLDLNAELKAALTAIGAQMHSHGAAMRPVWFKRARAASGFIHAKRAHVALLIRNAELSHVNTNTEHRQQRLARLSEIRTLAETDVRAGLLALITYMMEPRK